MDLKFLAITCACASLVVGGAGCTESGQSDAADPSQNRPARAVDSTSPAAVEARRVAVPATGQITPEVPVLPRAADTTELRKQIVSGWTRAEPLPRPASWPVTRAWRPLRHLGPFRHQAFSQIQIDAAGNWYFNDFFSVYPDAQWFSPYFNNNLPAKATPDPPKLYEPGAHPLSDGLGDVLLTLTSVRYSSKFGGSVELLFRSAEDYEFELRAADTLWDFSVLDITIYVIPEPSKFNRTGYGTRSVVVFTPHEPVAYEAQYSGSNLVGVALKAQDAAATETLHAAIDSLVLPNAARQTAARFVYGFIHGQFQTEIGTAELVTMMELSDDHLALRTQTGTQMFYITLQLTIDTDPEWKNVTGTIGVQHLFDPQDSERSPVFVEEFAFGSGESTPIRSFGTFDLELQCDDLDAFLYSVRVKAWGGLLDSAPSDWIVGHVPFTCSVLRDAAAAGQWGVAQGPASVVHLLDDDDEGLFGSVTVRWAAGVRLD